MVKEGHRQFAKRRVSGAIELDVPFPGTPDKSVLKQSQLNGVIFQ
jgi:hypothetical protein